MATPLCLSSSFTPSSTLVHPSTPYARNLPQFSTSFLRYQGHKLRSQRNIPLVINKIEPDPDEQEEVNDVGVKAALSVLNFYKSEISPLLPRSCRYVPTCSEYSMIAYKKYGFAKGSALTAWRICRCNPLGGSGFDPPRWFGEERPREE